MTDISQRAYPNLRFIHVLFVAAAAIGIVFLVWYFAVHLPTYRAHERNHRMHQLHRIGQAYLGYYLKTGETPKGFTQIAPYLQDDQELQRAAQEGEYTLIWNAEYPSGKSSSECVLGYDSRMTGLTLMGDGHVTFLTTEEIKQTPKLQSQSMTKIGNSY